MPKYFLETKSKAENDVMELVTLLGSVAKSLGIAKSVIQRWVARYEVLGLDVLSMKVDIYSSEFIVPVEEYMHENKMSLFHSTALFGIPRDETVGRWECI